MPLHACLAVEGQAGLRGRVECLVASSGMGVWGLNPPPPQQGASRGGGSGIEEVEGGGGGGGGSEEGGGGSYKGPPGHPQVPVVPIEGLDALKVVGEGGVAPSLGLRGGALLPLLQDAMEGLS